MHPPPAVVKRDGVHQRAQAEDHVDPGLAAGRAVVELAEQLAKARLVGMELVDADGGQAVEDAELLSRRRSSMQMRSSAGHPPVARNSSAVWTART
jgi:hypothetical protein